MTSKTQKIHVQRLHPEKYTLELIAVKASNVLQSNNLSYYRLLSKSGSSLRQAHLLFYNYFDMKNYPVRKRKCVVNSRFGSILFCHNDQWEEKCSAVVCGRCRAETFCRSHQVSTFFGFNVLYRNSKLG